MQPLIPNYPEILKTLKVDISRQPELNEIHTFFKNNMSRYQTVSQGCKNFPIDLLCAIHEREAGRSWKTCLHNGDNLPGPTTHVQKGRGPFASWEEAAIDALMMDAHNFPDSWTFESRLEFAEKYNGLGYRNHGILSPYVFAGTNAYTSGKYVSDGTFSSSAVDEELGVAAILLELNRV